MRVPEVPAEEELEAFGQETQAEELVFVLVPDRPFVHLLPDLPDSRDREDAVHAWVDRPGDPAEHGLPASVLVADALAADPEDPVGGQVRAVPCEPRVMEQAAQPVDLLSTGIGRHEGKRDVPRAGLHLFGGRVVPPARSVATGGDP